MGAAMGRGSREVGDGNRALRSLSLPSQTCDSLGRVTKSPEREPTPPWYQYPPLLIDAADNGNHL